jgi:hypothetical protein
MGYKFVLGGKPSYFELPGTLALVEIVANQQAHCQPLTIPVVIKKAQQGHGELK